MTIFDINFSFHGWSIHTAVTDTLATIGMLMIFIVPLIFAGVHRRNLNERLYTIVDGNKLFEKLKYDLKIKGDLTGIDRLRLFKNEHYARTVFRGAMEYNERDFVWYFNEKTAKQLIYSAIMRNASQIFWIWMLFLVVIFAGTELDFLDWMWQMPKMGKTSGIVAIWVLFVFFAGLHALIKWKEWVTVKRVVHDEVRRINLDKKNRVWNDFKIIFWSSIGVECLGFFLILLNIGF